MDKTVFINRWFQNIIILKKHLKFHKDAFKDRRVLTIVSLEKSYSDDWRKNWWQDVYGEEFYYGIQISSRENAEREIS